MRATRRGAVVRATRRGAVMLAALSIAGCIEVPPPAPKAPIVAKEVLAPAGVDLDTACTPTGVEVCYDARDDNCNGVIDEGCGLSTGILQFTIAWDAASADVDLNVSDPAGELASVGEPTSSGLTKDRDCPKPECQGQNVENVYLVESEPQRGRYRVAVRLDKLHDAAAPVRVRLGVRVGQRSFGASIELSPGASTEMKTFEFSL